MRNFTKLLKCSLGFLLITSCGSGDDPSISIQPSQDIYEQAAIERISSMDILWVIDNSGSMKSFQDQIRDNFISFMQDFTARNYDDFQIGVTVTDGFKDFNNDEFSNWSGINSNLTSADLPCDEGQTTGCHDYSSVGGLTDRFSTTNRSQLKGATCDECYSDPQDESTIAQGRVVRILSQDILAELRTVCEVLNNDADTTNNCEKDDSPGVLATGDEMFLELFDSIIDNTGVSGSGDERAFQSIQAARLNPLNKNLFRDSTHLAVVIVSDEDDTSVEDTSTRCAGYRQKDEYGALYCPNSYEPSFFKDFLELGANATLGVTVHNMGLNPKGSGYSRSLFLENGFLSVFEGEAEADRIPARDKYISGMLNDYNDNEVLPLGDFDFRVNNMDQVRYQSWVDNEADRKECRTIQIPLANNIFQRFFSRRHTELAESSGGVVASLCSDFAVSLQNIAQTIIERTSEFFLGDNVPSQSILDQNLVFVAIRNPNETEFTTITRDSNQVNGWDYNSVNNSIVFFGDAIPQNEAEISVVFDRESLN